MPKNLQNNPFAKLFSSVEEAEHFSREIAPQLIAELLSVHNTCAEKVEKMKTDVLDYEDDAISQIIEEVFGITLNKFSTKKVTYFMGVTETFPSKVNIDVESLEQALFERLMLEDPTELLLKDDGNVDPHVVQSNVITYLYECYKRLNNRLNNHANTKGHEDKISEMKQLIIRNISTALKRPLLYENQDLNVQFYEIFAEVEGTDINKFIDELGTEMVDGEDDHLTMLQQAFQPVFNLVHRNIAQSTIGNFEHFKVFSFINIIIYNKQLAEVFIDCTTPSVTAPGNVFSNTLIGSILCLSCLPKTNEGVYEFFDKSDTTRSVENMIWTALKRIHDDLHQVFLTLLKTSAEVRHKTLKWLGTCINVNVERGKLANAYGYHQLGEESSSSVSDAFILNLGAVLLRFCQPFIERNDIKYLKIDPTYTRVQIATDNEAKHKGVHLNCLHSETCFLPTDASDTILTTEQFNFVTECFFLAHKALDIGYRVCIDKSIRIVQDITRMESTLAEIQATSGASPQAVQIVKERLDLEMTRYLSMRTVLMEPTSLELITSLHVTTAKWIIQVLLNNDLNNKQSFNPTVEKELTFPLSITVPATLKCIPEFLAENLIGYFLFIRRINTSAAEENNLDVLSPILSLIIVLMGSSERVKNPHLQARLAECLESLLPIEGDEHISMNSLAVYCREQLFLQHPQREQLVPSLLSVFVGIEMTGQSVTFEQKFNYRRPMYCTMDYLWKMDEYRDCFKKLAIEAEENMEAVTPPLFLRFLNLLINDAVFLLDESLVKMGQLKILQEGRESGAWNNLSLRERQQNEATLRHIGMIAKFDNILGRYTIQTLEFLTTEIKSIFSHSTLVHRITAMLNYFLANLVGPNKKNFKVKDLDEYDFKPAFIVKEICKIYVNLSESEDFCRAVSQDGRSYNNQLFQQAVNVLVKIGGGQLIGDIQTVETKVQDLAQIQETEEEMLSDAPDEFLDPIMSTLMTDPVILPTSKIVVDRSTIARHLLSDQSDPFNRAPLTMEMIKTDEELKMKINNWIEERKKNFKG